MRIGIDGSCLSNRRGFGRFRATAGRGDGARDIPHRFLVFVTPRRRAWSRCPAVSSGSWWTWARHPVRRRLQGRRRWRDMIAMGHAVSRRGLDVMYFPATYSFFPVWNAGRLVVTMHDTLPLQHPELVFPRLAGRIAWRLKEAAAARWADRIVTVSQASRRAIQDWLGRPDPKVPGHHRGSRPDLRAASRWSRVGRRPPPARAPAGRAVLALRGRAQPAQEPAPAGPGLRRSAGPTSGWC